MMPTDDLAADGDRLLAIPSRAGFWSWVVDNWPAIAAALRERNDLIPRDAEGHIDYHDPVLLAHDLRQMGSVVADNAADALDVLRARADTAEKELRTVTKIRTLIEERLTAANERERALRAQLETAEADAEDLAADIRRLIRDYNVRSMALARYNAKRTTFGGDAAAVEARDD